MKNRFRRRLFSFVGSLVLAGGVAVGTASTAEASSPCSGSYLGSWSVTGGHISVYYNSATGKNCALTYTNNPGTYQQIYVEIGLWDGGASDSDGGRYEYYAGPVYVYAPHDCIYIEGRVGTGNYESVGPLYCS